MKLEELLKKSGVDLAWIAAEAMDYRGAWRPSIDRNDCAKI